MHIQNYGQNEVIMSHKDHIRLYKRGYNAT